MNYSNKLQPKKLRSCQGSAMVAVLAILAVALLIVAAVLLNSLIDTDMSFNLKKSDEAYNNAISAIEEANLRLLRDSSFSGATLNFTDGNAIINVTNISENERQITVVSRVGNQKYICQMQALAVYNINGDLTIGSVEEILN